MAPKEQGGRSSPQRWRGTPKERGGTSPRKRGEGFVPLSDQSPGRTSPRRAPVAVKRHRGNVIAQAPREDGGADGDFRGEGQAAASGSTGNRVIREGIGSSRQVESGFSPREMSAIEANLASWREHDRLILLTGSSERVTRYVKSTFVARCVLLGRLWTQHGMR